MALTLDTYAHVMPAKQPDAAELFMRLVFDGGQGDDEAEECTTDESTIEPHENPEEQPRTSSVTAL